MWWLLTWLVKPLGWAFEFLNKKVDANVEHHRIDAEVGIAGIEADVEFARLRKDLLVMYQGWWVTRWIVPGFAYPLILWFGAVVLDSVFCDFYPFNSFKVAALPPPLQEWAGQIILSFFLVRTVENVFNPVRGVLGRVVGGFIDRWTGGGGGDSTSPSVKTNFNKRRK